MKWQLLDSSVNPILKVWLHWPEKAVVTPFKLVVEWTQAVQLKLQELIGDLLIPFWRSLGENLAMAAITIHMYTYTYMYMICTCILEKQQPGEAHEECSLW